MKGTGRTWALMAGVALFLAACTMNSPTSSQSSPEVSPSSNPPTASPVAPSPSPEVSPAAALLAISSMPVHNGEVGVGYLAVTFRATGGTGPYTWALGGGTVPPGLTLSAGGVLTGNNTKAGTFAFDVKVSDAAGGVATGKTSLKVFPPLAVSALCANVCNVGFGCSVCGRFGTVTGGAGPYKYKVVGGAVPSGMNLSGFALTGSWPAPTVLQGPPVDVIGPPILRPIWSLGVSVTDGFGVTKTVSANWLEFGPIGLNCSVDSQCTSVPDGTPDTSISYFGGNPSDSVTVSVTKVCDGNNTCVDSSDPAALAAALPPNWSATASGGTVTVFMDCTNSPACANGSFYADVYIVLVDHGACVAPAYARSIETIVNVDV